MTEGNPGKGRSQALTQRLAAASIAKPRRTILLMALLTLAAAPGLLRLELLTDGQALMPRSDAAIQYDAEVRDHFGLRDPIAVVVESSHPDGILNAQTLDRIRELSQELTQLPGIGEDFVVSIATEKSDRVYTGTLNFRPFLDPPPKSPRDIERVRGDLEAVDILHGTLVSEDFTSAAILVGAPHAISKGRQRDNDRTELCRRITQAAQRFQGGHDRISVVGAPVAEALLGTHIIEDLSLILPISIATIALVLWLGCRRLWGVALGLIEVGACLIFTFGMMGWLGVPVYLTTAVLPVILVTIGLADEIHIFWRYQQILSEDSGRRAHPAALRLTMSQMTRPVLLTSLTTSIGFLSFLSSPLPAVRAFGLFAPLGILFCLLWSLTSVPAALCLLSPDKLRRSPRSATLPDSAKGPALLRSLLRRPALTLAAIGAATLFLGAGSGRLFVQDSWVDGFDRDSEFRLATDAVNSRYHGTHLLLVHLEFPQPDEDAPSVRNGVYGPLLEPENLEAVGRLEGFISGLPQVGGVLGPHSQLETTSFLRYARREEMRRIPQTVSAAALLLKRFDDSRGERRRREIIDDERRRAIVTIFLKDANYRHTAYLMEEIEDFAREHLTPHGARWGFAGDVAVSQAMIPIIVRTQIISLLLALAGALATVIFLHRSLAAGLAILGPACLAVLWTFGVMGWLLIPLGVATSMFCAITLGIGVDYSIHFYESFRRNLALASNSVEAALLAARRTGPAILADTVAIAAGFGLLMLSQVPANARLGLLVAIALAVNCVLTLVGLAAWLSWGRGRVPRPAANPQAATTQGQSLLLD